MLTSKYSHCLSLNAVTTSNAIGVGFGDIDLCTAGQFNQGPVVDRVPRYPSLQYEVIAYDTTGTTTATPVFVDALLPNGVWTQIDTGTIPLGAAQTVAFAKNYFGPFLDIRVRIGTISTGGNITAYISKWG